MIYYTEVIWWPFCFMSAHVSLQQTFSNKGTTQHLQAVDKQQYIVSVTDYRPVCIINLTSHKNNEFLHKLVFVCWTILIVYIPFYKLLIVREGFYNMCFLLQVCGVVMYM